MGVKSTKTITRADAESRYAEAFIRLKTNRRREKTAPLIDEAGYIGQPYAYGIDIPDLDQKAVIAIYHHVDAKIREDGWRTKARTRIAPLSDKELEDELERVNDEAAGGEGFENYIITERAGQD